jgi:nicotinate-nucleotide adenylyltransferase
VSDDPRDVAPAGVGDVRGVRLGVLGGSFNPPHRGHLALARQALGELGLDRVLLVPARTSPGKPVEEDPGPAHRMEMCRLAAVGVEGVRVCALELEREGPSYTVDTLRALHAAHPRVALTFILGADVAATLPTWHEARALPALARFAAALRAGGPRAGEPSITEPPSSGFPLVPLHMPLMEVSSSQVRRCVRRGQPIAELVGSAVDAYIAAHGLYRAPSGAGAA